MANCTCTGSSGSTYATVNRGYGCLSSVPTASGIPYNCFLPPTNMSYYQNYPFYNGPCGTVASSNSKPQQPATPTAPNCCCCCCTPQSGSSSGQESVPSTPLQPAIPTGKCCYPWYYPWCCCPTTSEDEEEEEDEDMTNPCCCFPWCCNPCAGSAPSVPSTPLVPPACKPCKPNVCCQPAALIATSNGNVTPSVSGTVPLTLVNSTSSALTVVGDTVTINCTGTYLITLTSNIPNSSDYAGTVSVALNGTPIGTTTQSFRASTAEHYTTQAIVKATKDSTLTITTSTTGSAITPTGGTSLFTITVVRIA